MRRRSHKPWVRVFIIFMLFSSAIKAHAFDYCEVRFGELAEVSPAQWRALSKVRGDRTPQLYIGEINGVRRVVIVDGEIHLQNEDSHKEGRHLIDAFPQRGVESYPGGPFWRAWKNFAYEVEGLVRGQNAGSTIAYAHWHAAMVARAVKVAKRYELAKMSEADQQTFVYRYDGRKFTGKEILALAEIAPELETINLEKGFYPNLSEKVAGWAVPSLFLAPRLGWLPALGAIPALAGGDPVTPFWWLGAGGLTWLGSTLVSTLYVNDIARILNPRRSDYMGTSIVKYFEDNPDRKVFLAVVGRNHGGPIGQQLEKSGFKRVIVYGTPALEN